MQYIVDSKVVFVPEVTDEPSVCHNVFHTPEEFMGLIRHWIHWSIFAKDMQINIHIVPGIVSAPENTGAMLDYNPIQ